MSKDILEISEAELDQMGYGQLALLAEQIGIITNDGPSENVLRARVKKAAYEP